MGGLRFPAGRIVAVTTVSAVALLSAVTAPSGSFVLAQDNGGAVAPGTRPGCGGSGGNGGAVAPGTSPDSDCDGLLDSEENYWQLDPYNPDTDGDGLRDGDEFYDRYGRSDPSRWDSDSDGLGDGQEVFTLGTDPWNWDTDGDGRGDGTDYNPRDPYR